MCGSSNSRLMTSHADSALRRSQMLPFGCERRSSSSDGPKPTGVKLAAPTEEGIRTARQLRDALDFAREPLAELSEAERTVLRDLLRRMLGGADDA